MLSENKEFLKFGDCVYLYSKTAIDLEDKGKKAMYPRAFYKEHPYMQGYMSAKGFFDDKVFFQRTTIGLSLDELEHSNLLNSRDNLFVVVPRLKHDFHLEYEKAQEDLTIASKQFRRLTDAEKARHKSAMEKFTARAEKAKQRAKKESKDNQVLMTSSYGKEAKYDIDVHLMHFDSKMFLCSMDLCSDTSQIGNKIIMTTFYQEGMNFKIHSKFKSRKPGDKIQYGDEVMIKNGQTGFNLCISDMDFEYPKDLSAEDCNPMLSRQNVFDPSTSKHQLFLGEGEFNTWKILGHSAWNTKETSGTKLFGHNLIRLNHAESGSYLYAGPSFGGSVPEVVLKRYYGENLEDQKSMNTIWEITHFCKIYQGDDFKTGQGIVKDTQNRILLRHFNTGKILAIGPDNLPYLQNFRETLPKTENSQHPHSPRAKQGMGREIVHNPRAGMEVEKQGVASEISQLSAREGFSVGGNESDSESGSSRDKRSFRASESGSKSGEEEDLFNLKYEEKDSFVKSQGSVDEDSQKRESAEEGSSREERFQFNRNFEELRSIKESKNDLSNAEESDKNHPTEDHLEVLKKDGLKKFTSNPVLMHQQPADEPSLGPNDPPVIKKPFSST